MSQCRRNNKKGGSFDGGDPEDCWIFYEQRVFGCNILISGGTELLEVLGTEARISIDILDLGSFPSWQGGQ